MTVDAVVAALARQQHGLITHKQAVDAGLTDRMIEIRVAAGRWIRRRRGVYAIAGSPETERQAVLAVCLAAGVPGGRSTAARLWGFELPPPSLIEVVGARVRLEGVRSYQSKTLVARDIAKLGSLLLTSPARTVIDCSGVIRPDRLGYVVDDALRRGLVRLKDLRECHERIATGPGRRPTIALREVLGERQPGYSAGDSIRELEVLRALTAAGLPAPVLGHRVTIGRHRYKLDIAWPESMTAIEWDGWDTHRTFSAFHGDRQRIRRLIAAGWTIVPATSKTNVDELVGDVSQLLCWHESTA